MKQPIPRWLLYGVATYALGTALWLLLWLVRGDEGWLLILVDHYGSLPPLLALPLLIFALVKRHWWLALALFPVLFFYSVLFGPYLIPHLVATTSLPVTPPDLSVMSYNVLWRNQDHAAIANLIHTHQPDLVALQEAGPELFAFLQEALGDDYVAAHMADVPENSTTAILSRYPVQRFTVLDLGAIRPAVIADLEIAGRTVTFVSAHLLYYGWLWVPWTELPLHIETVHRLQVQQAQILIEELSKHHGETAILACDCNSVDTSATQLLLNRRLTNAAKVTGWVLPQPNKPRLGPFYFPQRIDYIFYRGKVRPRYVYTIYDSGNSDHLPVLAAFDFAAE
ncbi:MAG: endonuclease/exonuclease/phosphatase family protein [Caldilineaceae bacterium]